MHLIQILLPVRDGKGEPFPKAHFARVRDELTERCGGVTAYTRAPAEGLWDDGTNVQRDEVVLFEAVAEDFDEAAWRGYRAALERLFAQEEIMMRVQPVRVLRKAQD